MDLIFPLISEPYFQFIYADFLEEQGDHLCEVMRLPWFMTPPAIRQCSYMFWDGNSVWNIGFWTWTLGDGGYGGYTDFDDFGGGYGTLYSTYGDHDIVCLPDF